MPKSHRLVCSLSNQINLILIFLQQVFDAPSAGNESLTLGAIYYTNNIEI